MFLKNNLSDENILNKYFDKDGIFMLFDYYHLYTMIVCILLFIGLALSSIDFIIKKDHYHGRYHMISVN